MEYTIIIIMEDKVTIIIIYCHPNRNEPTCVIIIIRSSLLMISTKSCHAWTQGVAEAQPEWAMEEQFWVNKLMPALKVSRQRETPTFLPIPSPPFLLPKSQDWTVGRGSTFENSSNLPSTSWTALPDYYYHY